MGRLAYGAFPVSWLQQEHRLLVTEDATEAEIPKEMCVKGILRGFKLSVAGQQEITTCTRNREKGGLHLFLLPTWGKVFACSKQTEDITKEDLHHARHCRGHSEIKHLCLSVFRKLETGEVLYIQCYRHFPISVAISRQWRGDLQSALMTWGWGVSGIWRCGCQVLC